MPKHRLTFAAFTAATLAHWRTAATVLAATVALALALALILPPSYRATTSFVTTEAGVTTMGSGLGGGGGGGLGSALAGSSDIMALASQFGLSSGRDPSESPQFYAQLLATRELLTRLLESRFPDPRSDNVRDSVELLQLVGPHTGDRERDLEAAAKRLQRHMQVTYEPRTNFVVLTVEAKWPELAAAIANRSTALVSAFNKEQRVSRAAARRDFLQGRVADAQGELRAQEDSQRLFYERNRSWENSPALLVEERRMRRQVETSNALYLSLRQQYEMARIDEVNNTPVITVVDRAVPPRQRSWPRYTLLLGAAVILGAGLGWLAAAAHALAGAWARDNPEDAALLRTAVVTLRGELARVLRRAPRAESVRDPRVA
jgi:uncharacterized protein involved in exopolysaccharide biosynthesis